MSDVYQGKGELGVGEVFIRKETDEALKQKLDELGKYFFNHLKIQIPDVNSAHDMRQFLVNNYYTNLENKPGLTWEEYLLYLEVEKERCVAELNGETSKEEQEPQETPIFGFVGLDPQAIRSRLVNQDEAGIS